MTQAATIESADGRWEGPEAGAAVRARVAELLASQDFRDALLQEVWDVRVGCAGRIANRLDPPMRAEEVQPVLEEFVRLGFLKKEIIGELSASASEEEILTQTLYAIPEK